MVRRKDSCCLDSLIVLIMGPSASRFSVAEDESSKWILETSKLFPYFRNRFRLVISYGLKLSIDILLGKVGSFPRWHLRPRSLFGSGLLIVCKNQHTSAKFWNRPSSMAEASTSTSFNTLERENAFRNPKPDGPAVPMLEELIRPHIESFDALFDDAGGPGLLQVAIDDMTPKVVFDGANGVQDSKRGNRLESTF